MASISFAPAACSSAIGRTSTGLLEHCWRGVDADHSPAGRLRYGDGHPSVPDRQFDNRPHRLTRKFDVEGHVSGHMR